MEHFAEDATLDMPRGPQAWGQRFSGKAAVWEGLAGRFKGLPDVHYGDARHFVSGDMGFSEWLLTGTTPGGLRVEVRGTDHYEFRLEDWGEMMRQAVRFGRLREPLGVERR